MTISHLCDPVIVNFESDMAFHLGHLKAATVGSVPVTDWNCDKERKVTKNYDNLACISAGNRDCGLKWLKSVLLFIINWCYLLRYFALTDWKSGLQVESL